MGKINRVWGLATGRGSTKGAARGAFTWREYPSGTTIPVGDWMNILRVEKNLEQHITAGQIARAVSSLPKQILRG